MLHGTRKVSKFVPEEVINSLPNNVITNIMDRLPIQDAVRTSILSRNWRSKWTLLSQLVFGTDFFKYIVEKGDKHLNGRIISRLILHLKGPITKFVLYTDKQRYSVFGVEDITYWIVFLSENGIEEFTLVNMEGEPLTGPPLLLPTLFFRCVELKHLQLHNCCLCLMPRFCCFPNLLSLELTHVLSDSYTCGLLLTRCPLLETLKLIRNQPGEIKLAEIAKLVNLKELHMTLCDLDNGELMTSSAIYHVLGFFPKLQVLTLDFINCKLLTDVEKRVPSVFTCLGTLTLSGVDFRSYTMVSCAIDLICDSPNLEDLMIVSEYNDEVPPPALCSSEVDFRRMEQLQLKSVIFVCSGVLKNEECLIKSLLSCSPLLKKMRIGHYSSEVVGEENVKLIFARKLLNLHRASPIAEIKLTFSKSSVGAVVLSVE